MVEPKDPDEPRNIKPSDETVADADLTDGTVQPTSERQKTDDEQKVDRDSDSSDVDDSAVDQTIVGDSVQTRLDGVPPSNSASESSNDKDRSAAEDSLADIDESAVESHEAIVSCSIHALAICSSTEVSLFRGVSSSS